MKITNTNRSFIPKNGGVIDYNGVKSPAIDEKYRLLGGGYGSYKLPIKKIVVCSGGAFNDGFTGHAKIQVKISTGFFSSKEVWWNCTFEAGDVVGIVNDINKKFYLDRNTCAGSQFRIDSNDKYENKSFAYPYQIMNSSDYKAVFVKRMYVDGNQLVTICDTGPANKL